MGHPDGIRLHLGLPVAKTFFNSIFAPQFPIDGLHLHQRIEKVAPVVPKPTKKGAVYAFGLLSATGTGILLAALVGGLTMKYRVSKLLAIYGRTIGRCVIHC